MEQFIVVLVFFFIALVGFGSALKFSKFKGESHNECDDKENCEIKKLGIKGLQCDH